jgi:hypothetical protein
MGPVCPEDSPLPHGSRPNLLRRPVLTPLPGVGVGHGLPHPRPFPLMDYRSSFVQLIHHYFRFRHGHTAFKPERPSGSGVRLAHVSHREGPNRLTKPEMGWRGFEPLRALFCPPLRPVANGNRKRRLTVTFSPHAVGRTRTSNLLSNSQLLYQLSYHGKRRSDQLRRESLPKWRDTTFRGSPSDFPIQPRLPKSLRVAGRKAPTSPWTVSGDKPAGVSDPGMGDDEGR